MSLTRDLVREIKIIAVKQRVPFLIVINKETFPMSQIQEVAKGITALGIPATFLIVEGDVRKAVAVTMFDPEAMGGQGEVVDVTNNREVSRHDHKENTKA